jgi:hypothetical protein
MEPFRLGDAGTAAIKRNIKRGRTEIFLDASFREPHAWDLSQPPSQEFWQKLEIASRFRPSYQLLYSFSEHYAVWV